MSPLAAGAAAFSRKKLHCTGCCSGGTFAAPRQKQAARAVTHANIMGLTTMKEKDKCESLRVRFLEEIPAAQPGCVWRSA